MVDFGQGGHGGAPAAVADALFNGHGGRKAADQVHVGPFHDFHVLTDIGRQCFQIAPLPLPKEDIEGQGGFSRSTHTGEHHQLVVGYGQIDVFQIVLTGAAHNNGMFEAPAVAGTLVDRIQRRRAGIG